MVLAAGGDVRFSLPHIATSMDWRYNEGVLGMYNEGATIEMMIG